MRYLVICLLAFAALAVAQEGTRIYTRLETDVAPQLRSGRTFVPVAAISRQFGATVTWQPAGQVVTIQRANGPTIKLTIGSRTATVDTRTVTLEAAPFIFQGRTMVPLRFISETYGIPVSFNTPTNSVYLYTVDHLYVLPFESIKSGITIADPRPNILVRSPVLVQGQGNVFEGALIIEVQDTRGRVLGRTTATAGMGGFYPYSTHVNYNQPGEDAIDGRIVVYSQDGRGNGRILARATVPVKLASTQ